MDRGGRPRARGVDRRRQRRAQGSRIATRAERLTGERPCGLQISSDLKTEFLVQSLFDQTYFTGNNNNALYPGEPRTAYLRLRANVGRR
jgi:outer membrane receptor for ferric coprogen and ferric-rhodotorulic acid